MTLIQLINSDTTSAMKAQDKFTLSVLRLLKSAIQNEAISKNAEMMDDDVISVVKKQVKVRKDSKSEYEKYNRSDLAENLEKEIAILSKYLPEEITDGELNKIIDEVFTKVNPISIKDMGTVMKELTQLLANRADMSVVSSLVKNKLQK